MTNKQRIEALEKYLKLAFCIDGECKVNNLAEVKTVKGKTVEGGIFKLKDSQRGTFFVGMFRYPEDIDKMMTV